MKVKVKKKNTPEFLNIKRGFCTALFVNLNSNIPIISNKLYIIVFITIEKVSNLKSVIVQTDKNICY